MAASAILFANDTKSVVLLDLPRSLELAQTLDNQDAGSRIISCKVLEKPYASTEPKDSRRRQELLSALSSTDRAYHESKQIVIQEALDSIHASYPGSWCLERRHGQEAGQVPGVNSIGDAQSGGDQNCGGTPLLVLCYPVTAFKSLKCIQGSLVLNASEQSTQVNIGQSRLIIPPVSAFLLSDVNTSAQLFSTLSRSLLKANSNGAAGTFDVIVVDPPWPNRSVRRSNRYATSETQCTDPFDAITFLFTEHLTTTGLVAVWITNKQSIRDRVLQRMRDYSLQLVEELIWVKVTGFGQPVTQLSGIWRRPYEVCLLFRPKDNAIQRKTSHDVGQRVIAATPDLHSRKPNLRGILQWLVPDLSTKRVLEVFARSLSAGSWAWGNEVLKFASQEHWTEAS